MISTRWCRAAGWSAAAILLWMSVVANAQSESGAGLQREADLRQQRRLTEDDTPMLRDRLHEGDTPTLVSPEFLAAAQRSLWNRGPRERPVDPIDVRDNKNLKSERRGKVHSWMAARSRSFGGELTDSETAACANSQKPFSRNVNPATIYDTRENLTPEGRSYVKACMLSAFDSRVEYGIQSWVQQRVGGLLSVGTEANPPSVKCSLTFLTPTTAVTARHCVKWEIMAQRLGDLAVVGVESVLDGKVLTNWTQTGVRVVLDGHADPASADRPSHQRDYVVLAPQSGAWPVTVARSELNIEPPDDVFLVGQTLFTWFKASDVEGEPDSPERPPRWIPYGDRSSSCVIGTYARGEIQGLHGCQSTSGTSGAMLLTFVKATGISGPVSARGFGIHIGTSDLDNSLSSQVKVNLAITLPALAVASAGL